tara:strand:+ start:1027 stop:1422 length:396 start_codon:yes stop_codon:yes gene_type:complete
MFLNLISSTLLIAQIPTSVNQNTCSEYANTYCIDQPLVPIVKLTEKCPNGFFASGGYCVPLTEDVMGIIPIFDGKLPEECPVGYSKNKGYCQTAPNIKKNAIPLIGEICPRGYFKNKSFCFKNCLNDKRGI